MWEKIIQLVKLLLGNAWNRTGSGLALIGASALTGWVDQLVAHIFRFDLKQTDLWVGFAVTLIGIGMLWFGRPPSNASKIQPHQHDVELLKRYRGLVFEQSRDVVRRVHFFNGVWKATLEPFITLGRGWRGAEYEFIDKELQVPFSALVKASDKFGWLILSCYRPVDPGSDYVMPIRHGNNLNLSESELFSEYQERTKALVDTLDDFERVARRKMPEVFQQPLPEVPHISVIQPQKQ